MTTLLTSVSLALLPVAYWAGKRSVRRLNRKMFVPVHDEPLVTDEVWARIWEDEDAERAASMAEAQGRRVG